MARTGRPPKEIDQKQFENLCGLQCTEEEICGVLSCDEATLNRWCKETYGVGFSQIYKEKRQGGKASLRRQQFKIAETNATMAIWLGKQYLGQTDTPVAVEHSALDKLCDTISAAIKEE